MPTEPSAARLRWHTGDNLRWLADQEDRPDYMPNGMLTGSFLIAVANQLEEQARALANQEKINGYAAIWQVAAPANQKKIND